MRFGFWRSTATFHHSAAFQTNVPILLTMRTSFNLKLVRNAQICTDVQTIYPKKVYQNLGPREGDLGPLVSMHFGAGSTDYV